MSFDNLLSTLLPLLCNEVTNYISGANVSCIFSLLLGVNIICFVVEKKADMESTN